MMRLFYVNDYAHIKTKKGPIVYMEPKIFYVRGMAYLPRLFTNFVSLDLLFEAFFL